jgi:hypothetical protein
MDDFNVSALHESKNEWGARLVTLLTPLVIDGYKSILEESIKLCKDNNEMDKYLMTFQNLISRIPKWNQQIVENERKRICEKSACNYLEDLVTCVHIIQLKILTAMRVGQQQKKIDINVPKLDEFIHKVYINVARKVYKNVYLFQIGIDPLQIQKNYRELEIIVQECIFNTLRESIPVEAILKAYMDETTEEDVIEEVKEEVTHEPIIADVTPVIADVTTEDKSPILDESQKSGVTFNDIDYVQTDNGVSQITAPKNIDRLEEISTIRNEQRKREDDDEDDNVKLNISDQSFNLDNLDIHNIEEPKVDLLPDLLLDEIEVLE